MFTHTLLWLTVLLHSCTPTTTTSLPSNRTLVVVPGMSRQSNRTNTVLRNLQLLHNHSSSDFHCLIHHYSTLPFPTELKSKFDSYDCNLQYFHESNHYADYLKSLLPSLLEQGNFAYVMILLDDVELQPNFRLHRLLGVMRRNGLSVASPAIQHASMSSTTPYKYSARSKQFRMPPLYTIGATVKSIEIFATLFTLEAWSCFWDMVEPRWNAAGWGYDLCYYNYCRNSVPSLNMGVVYDMTATHHKEFGRIQREASAGVVAGSNTIATEHPGHQYDFWVRQMKLQRNITLVPVLKNSRGKKLI